jgi:hypothetical protein
MGCACPGVAMRGKLLDCQPKQELCHSPMQPVHRVTGTIPLRFPNGKSGQTVVLGTVVLADAS